MYICINFICQMYNQKKPQSWNVYNDNYNENPLVNSINILIRRTTYGCPDLDTRNKNNIN